MHLPPSPPAPGHVRWFGCTDRGKVRPNNEDSFLGLQFDAREVRHLGKTGSASLESADCVFAVSDGMGGAQAGEFASRIAVEKIATLLPGSFLNSAAGLAIGFPDILMELFGEVHRALRYVGGSYEETAGMEATLTLCWFAPGRAYFGHIGDSRLYYLPARENRLQQLTQDDTHVAWLLRHGKITEWEARTHPRRNVLQKALGGGNQFVEPQVGAVAYEPGDTFLLCSDGLTKGFYDHRMLDILREPAPEADLARLLVDTSVANDGSDNTTAVVVQTISAPS